MHRIKQVTTPRFARCEQGSIAILAALSAFVVFGVVGLAIDYGQMSGLRRKAQAAIDTAVLAGSNPLVADSKRTEVFNAAFRTNYGAEAKQPDSLEFSYSSATGGRGVARFTAATTFLSAIGITSANIGVTSTAKLDAVDLEIVFALDISGSMRATDMGGGTRLDALKSSVGKLIDIIMANKSSGQSIKFAAVPFNMAVNIGTGNVGMVDNANHPLFTGSTWGGCVLERTGGFESKDTYSPGAVDGSGRWKAYIWPPAPDSGTCLNKSNGTNSGYSSVEPAPLGKDPWKDGPNFNCPRYPLERLTSSDNSIRTSVNGLAAYGNMGTTIGPAVGWALRLLSPDGPFKDGAPFSAKTRKIMIIVTDGELVTDGGSCGGATNTSTPYRFDPLALGLKGRTLTSAPINDSFTPYGYLQDSDPYNSGIASPLDADKELDRLAVAACAEAKNRYSGEGGVQVYTIAASTGAGPLTRAGAVLSACASDVGKFIYAADAATLEAAFKKIGQDVLHLRLTH